MLKMLMLKNSKQLCQKIYVKKLYYSFSLNVRHFQFKKLWLKIQKIHVKKF